MSYTRVDLGLSLQLLPAVMVVGVVCGVITGLVQGWALRGYGVTILAWTIATAIGMSLDFAVIYVVWLLRVMIDPFALGAAGAFFTDSTLWVFSLVHGCSLATVQWLPLRRSGRRDMAAWPWLAGISWSVLTPFLFAFLMETFNTNEPLSEVASAMGVLILFLPPLLLSLPYIILTTYLLERQRLRTATGATGA